MAVNLQCNEFTLMPYKLTKLIFYEKLQIEIKIKILSETNAAQFNHIREKNCILSAHYLLLELFFQCFILQGSNLIIQNLEKRIDDLELKLLFSKFGVITSAKVTKESSSLML